MLKLIVLAGLLILTLQSNSQILLDTNQVRIINKVFVERNFYKERTVELSLSLDTLQAKCNKTIAAKNTAVKSAQSLINIQNEIIANDSIALANYEKMKTKQERLTKFVKWERNVLFIGVAVLVVKFVL